MKSSLRNSLRTSLRSSPAQLSAPFSPLELSPQLWLDSSDFDTIFVSEANQTVPNDNNPFGYWRDKSAYARHCTLVNGDIRVNNNSSYNALRKIRFTGYQAQFIETKLSHLYDTLDVYILWNKLGLGGEGLYGHFVRILSDPDGSPAGRWTLYTNGAGERIAAVAADTSATTSSVIATILALPSGPEALNLRGSLSHIGGSVNFGNIVATTHTRVPTTENSFFRIGSAIYGFGSASPNCDLMEVVAFDYFLSDQERAKLKAYWESKWGASW